ncbi:MAG: hypothetical protein PHR53_03780 [Bacteroidales bacterium]|nr:hypothetical protein [Bacteroidales bacterium]
MKAKVFFVSIMMSLLIMDLHAQVTYQVGQVYEINGVKGLVYKVDSTGQHGMMMSLTRCEKDNNLWLNDKKLEEWEIKAYSAKDGEKNMQSIEKYINENKCSWEEFPLFQWAKSLGEGWYIPSSKELLEIKDFLTVSDAVNPKDKAGEQLYLIDTLSTILKDAGGDGLTFYNPASDIKWNKSVYCLSSSTETVITDKKGRHLRFCLCFVEKPTFAFIMGQYIKSSNLLKYGSRAVHKF